MSHELRTPMNSIIGFSELLIDGEQIQTPEERKELMQIIYDSAQLLLQLINDILSITKIESGQTPIEQKEFRFMDIVDQCQRLFQQKLPGNEFIIENRLSAEHETIKADQRLILQVLINLIGNALKFTPEGKRIGIIIQE